MIATLFITLTLVYFLTGILVTVLRNHEAHRFFKTRAPDLPVLPNPSIFSGHMYQVTVPDKNWRIIGEMHDKYGPTFGFYFCDQPWVATKDLDLLKLIEVDRAHKHINRAQIVLPFEEFSHSIFQINDDSWRRVRRAVSPALTNHKVRSDEVGDDIKSVIDQLQAVFKKNIRKAEFEHGRKEIVIDVHDMMERYTLAVIFLVTYKKEHVIDFDAEVEPWVEKIQRNARNINNNMTLATLMFPFIRPIIRSGYGFHEMGKLTNAISDYIVEATDIHRVARNLHAKVQKRLSITTGAKERRFSELKQQGEFKRRLVDTIIDSYVEKKISYEHFLGSLIFLLLAGFETTASALTNLIWHCAQNPDIQENLRKSIQDEGMDSDYVMWCINETIRWLPSVPLGTGRILGEDVEVNGTFLPKGTFVMPSTYSIHHDASIWPNPDKFDPERWRNSANFHPAAFIGFGLGPRNCVGGKLAIQEIKLVMRSILSTYRIEKCPETCDTYEFSAPGLLYVNVDHPIKVKLVSLK